MASRYKNYTAEGQDDNNACWAACLVWWLRVTNKMHSEQWEIMSSDEYSDLWNVTGGDGTISEAGILQIVSDSRWGMVHQKLALGSHLDYATLKAHLNFGPVYIGYGDIVSGANHVNIIYDVFGHEKFPQVSVMEPAFAKKSGGGFKGKHVERSLAYYRSSSNPVILASPKDPISLDR